MLYQTLQFLSEQLNVFFAEQKQADNNIIDKVVVLKNIAAIDEQAMKDSNSLLITLVNINEEATLKNVPDYYKENAQTIYRNPPVFLNLYILFSAAIKEYDIALIHLSYLLQFFQAKNTFTLKNSVSIPASAAKIKDTDDFKITVDLYSPTFEQANYLWSTLGGKQQPYALYKVRLVQIERDKIKETRPLITQIELTEQ